MKHLLDLTKNGIHITYLIVDSTDIVRPHFTHFCSLTEIGKQKYPNIDTITNNYKLRKLSLTEAKNILLKLLDQRYNLEHDIDTINIFINELLIK